VVSTIGTAPYAPALLERYGLGDRRAQHLGVGKRDVLRQRLALGRERARLSKGAADTAAPIDERIEHQREELAHQLERALLRAGRGFAGKQRESIGQITARELEQSEKPGWHHAAAVHQRVDRIRDRLLVQ